MAETCSYCGEKGHSIQQCPKWRGAPDKVSSEGFYPRIVFYGEGDSRNRFPAIQWLPLKAVRLFYLSHFFPSSYPEKTTAIELSGLGVLSVKGSVYLPSEALVSIEKQGKYSTIYKYQPSSVSSPTYFVPIYYEYNGEKRVEFQHLLMEPRSQVATTTETKWEFEYKAIKSAVHNITDKILYLHYDKTFETITNVSAISFGNPKSGRCEALAWKEKSYLTLFYRGNAVAKIKTMEDGTKFVYITEE